MWAKIMFGLLVAGGFLVVRNLGPSATDSLRPLDPVDSDAVFEADDPPRITAYEFEPLIVHTPGNGVDLGQTIVEGEKRTKAMIQRAFTDVTNRFANCAKEKLAGTVTVRMAIAPDGVVSIGEATTHVDPAVDACIVGVATALRFPWYPSTTMVRYPIELR
jgi:hypothetical protein